VQHRVEFLTIDSRVLYSITKEIRPEFDESNTEFPGENRETYWKNTFDFKRLKVSKQKVFTGIIETDGVAMCVHYRRLKAKRPVTSSISPVTKHEENKKADPVTQKVQDNDFVIGADHGNTIIRTIAAPKRMEDSIDGNLRQKDVRLLRFSRAGFYRESGITNARKKSETWHAGVKEHLEALSEVTSRGANFEAFLKFM